MPVASRVILVTGAGAGIGLALARRLAARDWIVYAGVRDLKRAARDLGDTAARPVRLDVTRPADARAALKRIQKECGRLDALVNNAGYGLYGAFEELSDAEFRAQFDTNFFGALELTRQVLPMMRAAGGGRILNVSSILGRMTLPTGSAYCSSKWALEAATEALRYEVQPFNIQVSLIEPGLIRTRFKANMQLPPPPNAASPYAPLTAKIGREYSGFSSSPDAAARVIEGALNARRPALRYRAGLDSRIYYRLHQWMPEPLLDLAYRLSVARLWKQAGGLL